MTHFFRNSSLHMYYYQVASKALLDSFMFFNLRLHSPKLLSRQHTQLSFFYPQFVNQFYHFVHFYSELHFTLCVSSLNLPLLHSQWKHILSNALVLLGTSIILILILISLSLLVRKEFKLVFIGDFVIPIFPFVMAFLKVLDEFYQHSITTKVLNHYGAIVFIQ